MVHLDHDGSFRPQWFIWTTMVNLDHDSSFGPQWFIWTTMVHLDHDGSFKPRRYAVERFCKLLENFKAASTITFKVEISAKEGGEEEWIERARRRLARFLAPQQRASTSARLRDMAARTTPEDLSGWEGYRHWCDCLNPRTLGAQQRRQLLSDLYYRISFLGMMQAVNEFNNSHLQAEDAEDKVLKYTRTWISENLCKRESWVRGKPL
ncbi:hypothetical protein RR48_00721 [Papilio machaon]|uniref:Uncharacterized protein n=1 Tax=Papilio machaon TaxID=76193 RepID=A0A0N1PJ35_PAPMA|nr:hypothetical protein RR48_00721 [Papilio machaon]